MVDGELVWGTSGCAGEIGHMIIDSNGPLCNCGNHGCLEALTSGGAVAKVARRRLANGEKSLLSDLAEGDLQNISAKTVSAAARQGDALALEIISQAGRYLGIGMANLINLFNPDRIIIGGGLSKMGDLLFDPMRQSAKESAFKLPARDVEIVPSQLGDNVCVQGAALCLAPA